MFTIFFSSCKEDEIISSSYVNVNILEKEVEYTNARIMWSVSTDATISNVLFEYATDTTFVKSVEVPMTSTVNRNNFYAILDTLKDGVKYYIRCKVVNKYNSLTKNQDSVLSACYQSLNLYYNLHPRSKNILP